MVVDIALISAPEAAMWQPGKDISTFSDQADQAGAVASFIGRMRPTEDDRPLSALVLEHYPGMTERALTELSEKGVQRFGLSSVLIRHRVGRVAPGDPIVLVAVAALHRAAAFDGCAFVMDWLKTKAPFWKQAVFADGTTSWIEAKDSDTDRAMRWESEQTP